MSILNVCQVSKSEISERYTLAVDLGSNSLGLAIRFDSKIAGSHVITFPDYEENDKGFTPNQSRRMVKRQRKTLFRKAGRLNKVFKLLSHAGAFPVLPRNQRHELFASKHSGLDKKLFDQYAKTEKFAAQLFPYILRAKAARGEDLSAEALARALYHLAQKRRFRSGKKEKREIPEDSAPKSKRRRAVTETVDPASELKIRLTEKNHSLSEELCAQVNAGAIDPLKKLERTVGGEKTNAPFQGFFLAVNREMILAEFDKIRSAQQDKQPVFSREISTDEFFRICSIPSIEQKAWLEQVARVRRKQGTLDAKFTIWDAIRHAIFFQHDLQPQEHLIGHCRYLPTERRAPIACLEFQEKRYLEKINYLRLENNQNWRLSGQEREVLISRLEMSEELSCKEIRELCNLSRGAVFNFEVNHEHSIPGNRTNARIFAAIGRGWEEGFEHSQKVEIIESLRRDYPDTIHQNATQVWGLNAEQASKLAEVEVEDGYNALSLEALRRILPDLRKGVDYSVACENQPEFRHVPRIFEKLPPVLEWDLELRNPIVIRALSELRKAVNHIIRSCGRPETVRVELNRELRKHWLDENAISNQNKANRMTRKQLKSQLRTMKQPSEGRAGDDNILKLKLAIECGYKCPYCGDGKGWSNGALFSNQVQVEHVIPQTLWGEGRAFENLTLACIKCNLEKSGQTPWDAFGPESPNYNKTRWDAILCAVDHFKGTGKGEKARRFILHGSSLDEFLKQFNNRQGNDSAYASRRAGDYLSLLFGGRWDAAGKLRVQTCSGDVTGVLRRHLGLERLWKELWGPPPDAMAELRDKGQSFDIIKRYDHRHHALDAMVIALAEPAWVKVINNAAARRQQELRKGLYLPDLEEELQRQWPKFFEEATAALALDKTEIVMRTKRKIQGRLHLANAGKKEEKGVFDVELEHGWFETRNNYCLRVTTQENEWVGTPIRMFEAAQWSSGTRAQRKKTCAPRNGKAFTPPWAPAGSEFLVFKGDVFKLNDGKKYVVRQLPGGTEVRIGYIRLEDARPQPPTGQRWKRMSASEKLGFFQLFRKNINQLMQSGFEKVVPTI